MIEALGEWVKTLVAAAIFAGAALSLTPKGPAKAAVGFVCAVMLTLALLQPLTKLEPDALAEAAAAEQLRSRGKAAKAAADAQLLFRLIIMEETEEYILNKADLLDIEGLTVEVMLKQGDTYPYPHSVRLTGEATPEAREKLGHWLEGELGIPAARQSWSGDGA